eukprot:TRINITY_DN13030_c0_g1_i1.p1 TRINITY_DN13030_c0_g1~~TRINITY_DN13030_c0_g1_i1.p1  ORF type:complete len:272 (+),score=41.21 TRINITY_DN13030_c0_g1_i1:121-816(+)
MTWTPFRPSDDECLYGYLVPANMFASASLRQLAVIAADLWSDSELQRRALTLADQIDDGIKKHAIITHPTHGKMYAYEVDGLGHSLLMDDANVPSLMSIPYLGWDYDEEIYQNTRNFILSADNPTYAHNKAKSIYGYGSPHMAERIPNNIWPMGQIMMGLTSKDPSEKLEMVKQLVKTTGRTGWMHESYDPDRPSTFTRKWFCWADALFAELVMSLTDADCIGIRPHLQGL